MLEILLLLLCSFLNDDKYKTRELAQFVVETLNNSLDLRKPLDRIKSCKATPLETRRRLERAQRTYMRIRPFFTNKMPMYICYNGVNDPHWRTCFREHYWSLPQWIDN